MDAGQSTQRTVVVTGGGTAGHVHPGLALADELVGRGWSVSWIGREGSLEEALVKRAGLDFEAVPAAPVVGRGLIGRARAVGTSLRGALTARRQLGRLRPQAVVGTGGFVSFPAVLAARTRRIPVLLFEPNASMGVANKVLSRFADRVAWGQADESDPDRLVTGVPVGPSFKSRALRELAAATRSILVLGGSQGSAQLNQAMPAALAASGGGGWAPVRVVHQCGVGRLNETRRRYAEIEADAEVSVVEFIDDVAGEMAAADVVVSRAGAQTLAELAAVGCPAVLVPLGLAGGHQAMNAAVLERDGAAWSLIEDDPIALGQQIAERLATLFANPGLLDEAAGSMARRDAPAAASKLADEVIDMAEAA